MADSSQDIDPMVTEEGDGGPHLLGNLGESPMALNENPVHLDGHNTIMPFPSDVFAYRDEASPTGVRVKFSNSQFPPEIKTILDKLPESLHMDTLYKEPDGSDLDGFSITSNVLFEFDRDVDAAWVGDVDENMARDGGDTFYLLDLTTGEFIPALANQSHFARDPHRTTQDIVMQVMARERFEYGRRYMAFVTTNFKDRDGNDFACSSGFEKAKSNDGSAISKFYEPWLAYLESEKNMSRDQILSATIFTTRSRASSTGPLVDMYKTVLNDEFTSEHVVIHKNLSFPHLFLDRIIYGRLNFRDFRDENGVLTYTPGFKGARDKEVDDWVPFLLFIPDSSFPKPFPVNIAGSGIVMTKEMMIPIAIANASLGVATISIDWPSHGERIKSEGWSVLKGVGFIPGGIAEDAADMPRLLSMFLQIPIDIMSTYRALTTYFATSDEPGMENLDMRNMSFTGISLGALSGTAASACIPDLNGTFLSVASVNFNKLLSSGRFLLGGPSMAMPEGLPGSWYALGMNSIVAIKGDLFDGVHYADGFRNGVPEMGTGPRPLTATYARNDGWVTAECGVALKEIADLPLIYSQEDPENLRELIANFMGKGKENTLADNDNYAMVELTLMNNDFNINQTFERLGIPRLVYRLTGHDWYDISGTLEHAGNAMSPASIFYMLHFINNIQCGGNAETLSSAAQALSLLSDEDA